MSNVEHGMSNFAAKDPSILIYQGTKRSDSILRHSAVRYSIFFGSFFNPATVVETANVTQFEISTNRVSYEGLGCLY